MRIGSALMESIIANSFLLAADSGAGGGLGFIVPLAGMFGIFYFLIIRPQQQQRRKTQEMLSSLKTGDRVATSGGIHGTIVSFRNGVVQLQIANQVKVDVTRSAITGIVAEETSAEGKQDQVPAKQKK